MRRSGILFSNHSMKELMHTVSQFYQENRLHELKDEDILCYGKVRRIPIVGKRDEIVKRLYKYLYRRECSELVNIVCYDLEFTGLPNWSEGDGMPDQEIIEIGAYYPLKEESFSCLVRPQKYDLSEEAAHLTQISPGILQSEGEHISTALRKFYHWLSRITRSRKCANVSLDSMSSPGGMSSGDVVALQHKDAGSFRRDDADRAKPSSNIMLVSHGGTLNDIKMLKYYSKASNVAIPDEVFFADSMKLLKECTQNKGCNLSVLKLDSLKKELGITFPAPNHRALADAKITWEVLRKAILLYNSTSLAPEQEITKKYMQWRRM